jgi:hypothetical protein
MGCGEGGVSVQGGPGCGRQERIPDIPRTLAKATRSFSDVLMSGPPISDSGSVGAGRRCGVDGRKDGHGLKQQRDDKSEASSGHS